MPLNSNIEGVKSPIQKNDDDSMTYEKVGDSSSPDQYDSSKNDFVVGVSMLWTYLVHATGFCVTPKHVILMTKNIVSMKVVSTSVQCWEVTRYCCSL